MQAFEPQDLIEPSYSDEMVKGSSEEESCTARQSTSSEMWREDVGVLMRSRQGDAACEMRERRKRADGIRVSVNLASSAHSLLGLLAWAGKNMESPRAVARAIERYMLDASTSCVHNTALNKQINQP